MTGFILAAGFGTRLRPLTDHIPKALAPMCGRPLLGRAVDFLRAGGFSRIAVNSHHHHDQIEVFLDSQESGCALFHETGHIRGTGGALFFAREFLAQDDIFCVANVDIIATVNLRELCALFRGMGCEAGLVAIPSPAETGTIWYDSRTMEYGGPRLGSLQAPVLPGEGEAWAEFLGIAFYKPEMLGILGKDDFSVLPVWKRMQDAGMSVKVVEAPPTYWNDLGTPGRLAAIHFDFLDGRVDMPVPEDIVVDKKAKKAYPGSMVRDAVDRLGAYTWTETASLPASTRLSHAVVFKDAVIPENSVLDRVIATPYGVIDCGA